MTRFLAIAALAALCQIHGHCQPPFEVASITPCAPGTPMPAWEHHGIVQFISPGGRFTARDTTIAFLLEWSYDILPAQHSPGPGWFSTDRYDVLAEAAGNPSDDQMKLMVQKLLEDRFHLVLRHETREVTALVLTLGKSAPKLSRPKPEEEYSLKMEPVMDGDQKVAARRMVATRFSFEQLNRTFARVLERVIVNQTGLSGDYDFSFELRPDDARPNPLDPALIIDAMQEQLGLNVSSKKTPVDYLAIDSVEKVKAGN